MNLIEKVVNCNTYENLDILISDAIKQHDENSIKIEQLGFYNNRKITNVFKGFIGLNTRIKYQNIALETYSMNTTDFFYEFARFIKKYQISTKQSLIFNLEFYINQYFGIPKQNVDLRANIFNDRAWNSTSTDEEYFKALENNKIGDLKGLGVAQCTERSALAQQILSIFDTESYYCIGAIQLGDKQEEHCFNIVKRKNDYALLDYSCPVASYDLNGKIKGFYPFVGQLSNKEYEQFINNGIIKSFDEYEYINNKKNILNSNRKYTMGTIEIKNHVEYTRN